MPGEGLLIYKEEEGSPQIRLWNINENSSQVLLMTAWMAAIQQMGAHFYPRGNRGWRLGEPGAVWVGVLMWTGSPYKINMTQNRSGG